MKQKPTKTDWVRHIDEIDMLLSNLLHEVRLIAGLSDAQPPQLFDIDSRGLTALLEHIAADLQAVQSAVAKVLAE